MTKYYYVKKIAKKNKTAKIFGSLFIILGIGFLFYFTFPIISYHPFFSSVFASPTFQNPLPQDLIEQDTNKTLLSLPSNFEDARNWYPEIKNNNISLRVDYYTLSIPKLKIEHALVATKDYNLSRHLVQYFNMTTPPETGVAVIVGHSTVPQLFNAKNYRTIFANLHRLKKDDIINIHLNGTTYTYVVTASVITEAEEVEVYKSKTNTSNLYLVTCTPPGTVWKRLIVKSQLSEISSKK